MMASSRIARNHDGLSLIDYLAGRFTYLTKEQWNERICEHRILVNENVARADIGLKAGDVVSYLVPEFDEPVADINYTILYEDEWIVAVNKPGNLLVHKAGKSITRNLVFLLRHCSGNPLYASLNAVTRLDRETSGLVLFAKDMQCLKRLHRDFAAGVVKKEYLAVVANVPKEQICTIDLPVGPDKTSAVHYKFCIDEKNGKNACTHVETLSSSGSGYAIVRVRPVTGRTHQIRIHLAAIRCPVVGDKLYGMSEADYLAWRSDPVKNTEHLAFPRQALHCSKLNFSHPSTGKEMSLEAPLPEDISQLIKKLHLQL